MSVYTDMAVDAAVLDEPTPHQRDQLDRYYTDPRLAAACVAHLRDILPFLPFRPRAILEPSVGGGAFVGPARKLWPGVHITGVDIDRDAAGLRMCDQLIPGDFLAHQQAVGYDLVLGNPPYRDAEAHVRHALDLAPVVAFVLRLGFLASRQRRPFWADHPALRVDVLRPRPSFMLSGKTDGTEYGFFIWRRGHVGSTTTGFIDWRE